MEGIGLNNQEGSKKKQIRLSKGIRGKGEEERMKDESVH